MTWVYVLLSMMTIASTWCLAAGFAIARRNQHK
ncbi:hypothetical protein PS723_04782 [Pseudomonas fluorescens]|uniref:Uncharacterized protein n=1 Tax=Pseudomonas fluorescens TaxID=294 RepID=A0A5E7ENF8_PSEFL|nr:hypothetical protein PS723_04782 [Pseudomonas fluorescens]